jgi:cyclophilin family peptidyl-prolyl cis-trans isomerase
MASRSSRWALGFLALSAALAAGCSSETATDPAAGGEAAAEAGAASTEPAEAAPPRVVLQTSKGPITIELDPEHAPLTVRNFLAYADGGHYDKTVFHQAIAGYIVLGGGLTADLDEKPTRHPVRNEADNGLSNVRGAVAMARAADAIDSSASQFYINVADNKDLDYKGRSPADYGYCVFGRVVEGMDVVDEIAAEEVHDTADYECVPVKTVLIESVRRAR